MKFNEALEQATQSDDVEGLPKRVGKIVRRKVPAGYTVMSKGKAKKKKKKEDEDEEKEVSEAGPMSGRTSGGLPFQQASAADSMHRMAKFWRGRKKKKKGTTVKKKEEEEDEE